MNHDPSSNLYDIELHGCKIKSVRADLLKNTVALTFEAHLDEEMQLARRTLAILSVDESPVDLSIREQAAQLRLTVVGQLGISDATEEPTP